VDLIDNNQETPLYYAIKSAKVEVCDFLIKSGANVNMTNKKGITLMKLAKDKKKHVLMDLLQKAGATPIQPPVKQKEMPPPPKANVNERSVPKSYILTTLKDGYYQPLTEEEFQTFLNENQDLARYFKEDP